jgi:DNA-binding transcriptional LysR family regulator
MLGGELADLRQGVSRHIRLCASTAAINQFLPPLLAQYAGCIRRCGWTWKSRSRDAVAATLREGRADVGVFVQGPDTAGLDVRTFASDELVLVLPAGHRLRGKAPLAFVDTLDEEWISLTAARRMLQKQQEAALAANRPLRLRMQVRSFDAVCHMVARAWAWPCCPRRPACPCCAP